MSQATTIGRSTDGVEQALRDELARCEVAAAAASPVLGHLLANEDSILYSDAVVARVRGMIADLADQLLGALEQHVEVPHRTRRQESLARALASDAAVVDHAHAVALEARLTERLQARGGVDEVFSPLLQELSASQDAELAKLAQALAGSQTRFMQCYRQMTLPLVELSVPAFEGSLSALRAAASDEGAGAAERALRESYRDYRRRVELLDELVGLVPQPKSLLSVEDVGLATFASALAKAFPQTRDRNILLLTETQALRLVIVLRASGLQPRAVEQQLQALHPDLSLPEGFETLSPQGAAALLGGEAPF